MKAADYGAWYDTPRGRWIDEWEPAMPATGRWIDRGGRVPVGGAVAAMGRSYTADRF